ncbi:MAG: flagellar hook-length control protein FliK [Proteobacteria bacterium]|nr:flagellar hook-length control protein FliK [Pseudomonadota bacterium]
MVQDNLVNQLSLMFKLVEPPLLNIAETVSNLPPWQPGQKLPAVVVASLPTGRFQVQVQNQLLDMNLPKNTQPGMSFNLVFVGSQPRPTFLLQLPGTYFENTAPATSSARQNVKEQPAQSTQVFQVDRQNMPPQSADTTKPASEHPGQSVSLNLAGAVRGSSAVIGAPLTPSSSPTTSISEKARALVSLLKELQDAPVPKARPASPLVEAPTLQGAHIAEALRHNIEKSGLFYESHLVRWVQGKLNLQSLAQEPQNQLNVNPGSEKMPALPTGQLSGLNTPNLSYVQSQIGLLNTGVMIYQGELWPRLPVELHIYGQSPTLDQEQQPWQTLIHITLPRIGKVSAWLLYAAGGVSIHCETADMASKEELMASKGLLSQQMESAGLHLTKLTVRRIDE